MTAEPIAIWGSRRCRFLRSRRTTARNSGETISARRGSGRTQKRPRRWAPPGRPIGPRVPVTAPTGRCIIPRVPATAPPGRRIIPRVPATAPSGRCSFRAYRSSPHWGGASFRPTGHRPIGDDASRPLVPVSPQRGDASFRLYRSLPNGERPHSGCTGALAPMGTDASPRLYCVTRPNGRGGIGVRLYRSPRHMGRCLISDCTAPSRADVGRCIARATRATASVRTRVERSARERRRDPRALGGHREGVSADIEGRVARRLLGHPLPVELKRPTPRRCANGPHRPAPSQLLAALRLGGSPLVRRIRWRRV